MLAPLIKPSSVGSYCKVWIMKWCNSVTLYKVALHYCDTIQGDRSLQPLTTDSGTQINHTTDRSSTIAQQWVGANTNKRIYLEISTTCPADEVMTPRRPDMSAMVDYMFEYIN